jgi:hypothetical protein
MFRRFMDKYYFVSREGSMGEPVRPGTPQVGKTVGNKDPYWTVYKWVDKTTKTAQVIHEGFSYEDAQAKARQLNAENNLEPTSPKKLPRKQDKEYLRNYNREYARKRRARRKKELRST